MGNNDNYYSVLDIIKCLYSVYSKKSDFRSLVFDRELVFFELTYKDVQNCKFLDLDLDNMYTKYGCVVCTEIPKLKVYTVEDVILYLYDSYKDNVTDDGFYYISEEVDYKFEFDTNDLRFYGFLFATGRYIQHVKDLNLTKLVL